MKATKKPVTIECFLYEGMDKFLKAQEEDTLPQWANIAIAKGALNQMGGITNWNGELKIATMEGVMTASVGDYIIQGIKGEIYPCKPDIFNQSYDIEAEDQIELGDNPRGVDMSRQ